MSSIASLTHFSSNLHHHKSSKGRMADCLPQESREPLVQTNKRRWGDLFACHNHQFDLLKHVQQVQNLMEIPYVCKCET